jgi:hypothetical protein
MGMGMYPNSGYLTIGEHRGNPIRRLHPPAGMDIRCHEPRVHSCRPMANLQSGDRV